MSKSDLPAHLLLAELALKRAQNRVRGRTQKGIQQSVIGAINAPQKTARSRSGKLGKAALMYGVTRLASRSLPGALLVGGGYLVKKMLDAKRRQKFD